MAVGWLTVLKLVPWVEVIKNAPAIADGAKKLWATAGRPARTGGDSAGARETAETGSLAEPATPELAALQARLASAEEGVARLQEQMQASTALIKALAEQNAELVQRVEANRRRTVWLGAGLLVLALLAGLQFVLALRA
jgi:hypothetical protein